MKPLIETNPYLINKENRESSTLRSVISSCGVEGIIVKPFPERHTFINPARTQEALNKIKTRLARG